MISFLVLLCIGMLRGLLGQNHIENNYLVDPNCECGIEAKGSRRIVNGQEVQNHKFPWTVYITIPTMCQQYVCLHCGGSIINNLYIMTAGHCVIVNFNKIDSSKMKVVVGAHILDTDGFEVGVKDIILHPKYNLIDSNNDIALLKLESPLRYSQNIKPICLPKGYKSYENQYGLVAGWGLTEHNKPSKKLLYTKLRVSSDETCKRKWNIEVLEHICAHMINTTTCTGDSGGSLFTQTSPYTYEVIGILSFGSSYCDPVKDLSAFTRVSSYIKWIYDNTKDAVYCLC